VALAYLLQHQSFSCQAGLIKVIAFTVKPRNSQKATQQR